MREVFFVLATIAFAFIAAYALKKLIDSVE